jgi:transcriptional regulator with XRE-family HTH domain
MTGPEDLGPALVWLGDRAGLNQDQFARRVGVNPGTVSAWSTGTQEPTAKNLAKVMDRLPCTQAEIDEVTEFYRRWRIRMRLRGTPADSTSSRPAASAASIQAIKELGSPPSDPDVERAVGRAFLNFWNLLAKY